MGLPVDKLIVATNENDILCRVINSGEYRPSKVKPSLSPSMDIQVASNFERLLFDVLSNDDQKVAKSMQNLKENGFFKSSSLLSIISNFSIFLDKSENCFGGTTFFPIANLIVSKNL